MPCDAEKYIFLYHTPPRRYIQYGPVRSIRYAKSSGKDCLIEATVTGIKKKNSVYLVFLQDETDTAIAVYFKFTYYHTSNLSTGSVVYLCGKYNGKGFVQPRIITNPFQINPVYRGGRSVKQKITKILSSCKDEINKYDVINKDIRNEVGLPALYESLRMIHRPASETDIEMGRWSMAFREAYTCMKDYPMKHDGYNFEFDHNAIYSKMKEIFPFELTNSQRLAVSAIMSDLRSPYAMRRILTGDVGSGKTEVAIATLLATIEAGYTALYLCPTEVLAVQTYHRIAKALAGIGGVSLFISGDKHPYTKGISVYVGTHALLHHDWSDYGVGTIIVDEQHKFGVKHREGLLFDPWCNYLEITATPIPRTYAYIMGNLLDISTLKPIYEKQVETLLYRHTEISGNKYNEIVKRIDDEIEKGNQALLIYPSRESEKGNIKSARRAYEFWENRYNKTTVALLHGKVKDKGHIINKFRQGEIKILVSTSASEVGIDVENLTICVVSGAERFGLVQLHQIRGRVGRRGQKGYMILISKAKGKKSFERLKILCEYSDGFKIAEYDAQLRDIGNIGGTEQSGRVFRYFNKDYLDVVPIIKHILKEKQRN